jgi:fructokinase
MTQRATVVGLGEVLWDVFPDGARFGGAPANFACGVAELAGDRLNVFMVSQVGRDELGQRALQSLRERGVDTRYVQAVERPTGQVFVNLNSEGQASYQFAADTAWDNLKPSPELEHLAAQADAVCFGTLGQRAASSRETIQWFLGATSQSCLRVLDVNLRPPFWNREIVLQSLQAANVVKLNVEELAVLADLLGFSGSSHEFLQHLVNKYSLELAALTKGAEGATLLSKSGECSDLVGEPVVVVDTVGAGDWFTAVLVIGLLHGLSLEVINAWGTRVGAYVCSQAGATPVLPAELRQP